MRSAIPERGGPNRRLATEPSIRPLITWTVDLGQGSLRQCVSVRGGAYVEGEHGGPPHHPSPRPRRLLRVGGAARRPDPARPAGDRRRAVAARGRLRRELRGPALRGP